MHLVNSFKLYKTKLTKLKRVIGKCMVIVGDFNTHLKETARTTGKNV